MELLPRPARPVTSRRPRTSGFSAWVKRDAELFAALEVARELGSSSSVNRAQRSWREHFRTMPTPVGRRGSRGRRR